MPKVIKFLGHNPLQSNATTLGERIKQYRIQKVESQEVGRELALIQTH